MRVIRATDILFGAMIGATVAALRLGPPAGRQGSEPRTGTVDLLNRLWRPSAATTTRREAEDGALRLADAALEVADRMRSRGRCYAGVKRAVWRATGVRLKGRSAYRAAAQLAASPAFEEVDVPARWLRRLGPGYIVVWPRTPRSPHGHVSVTLGEGWEASDHVQRQLTSLRGYRSVRVFRPR